MPTGRAAVLLILLFAASLLWCGDADCWSGTSDGQCSSLICALFASHNAPGDAHASCASADCMCACHMPTLAPAATDLQPHLTAQTATFIFTASTPVSPVRIVYHPPRS